MKKELESLNPGVFIFECGFACAFTFGEEDIAKAVNIKVARNKRRARAFFKPIPLLTLNNLPSS